MKMILLTGAQGAGKSTFFQSRFRDSHARINIDMLRTRQRQRGLIEACPAFKQLFLVDNTNTTRAGRARYLLMARGASFSAHGCCFFARFETLLERNAGRIGKASVPDAAIRATLRRFEQPSLDEGSDALHRVTLRTDGDFEIAELTR